MSFSLITPGAYGLDWTYPPRERRIAKMLAAQAARRDNRTLLTAWRLATRASTKTHNFILQWPPTTNSLNDGPTTEPTVRSEISLPPTFSTTGTLRSVKPNIIYDTTTNLSTTTNYFKLDMHEHQQQPTTSHSQDYQPSFVPLIRKYESFSTTVELLHSAGLPVPTGPHWALVLLRFPALVVLLLRAFQLAPDRALRKCYISVGASESVESAHGIHLQWSSLGIYQFYGSVQPIFYESSTAHAPLLWVFLCADSFHRRGGNEKINKKNQKGREKQFAVRIETSTKSGWRQGLEPAINKIGPHTSGPPLYKIGLPLYQLHQRSRSILDTSILFYDLVQVSIFFLHIYLV